MHVHDCVEIRATDAVLSVQFCYGGREKLGKMREKIRRIHKVLFLFFYSHALHVRS